MMNGASTKLLLFGMRLKTNAAGGSFENPAALIKASTNSISLVAGK